MSFYNSFGGISRAKHL